MRTSDSFILALALLWLAPACQFAAKRTLVVPEKTLRIMHRGARKLAPENTIPAYRLAMEHPAVAGIEMDVRMLKDGTLVNFHDSSTMRTTNDLMPRPVSGLTWAQFSNLDHGSWFSAEFAGVEVLPFEKTIQLLLEKYPAKWIVVDVKSQPAAVAICSKHRMLPLRNVVLAAGNREVARRLHENCPEHQRLFWMHGYDDLGFVTRHRMHFARVPKDSSAALVAQELNRQGIAVVLGCRQQQSIHATMRICDNLK